MEQRITMILTLLFFNIYVTTARIPVLKQSDPNKYWKLNAAFSGYDIINGDPMPAVSVKMDPGIRNALFKPVKLIDSKYYEWDGCSVIDFTSCDATLESKVVTTAKEYREFTSEMSKEGSGAGFKHDIHVEASDSDKMISISTDYEISASSSWGKSKSSSKTHQQLSEGSRAMSLAYAECSTNNVQLQGYKLPRFTAGFRSGIEHMASVSTSSKPRQQAVLYL